MVYNKFSGNLEQLPLFKNHNWWGGYKSHFLPCVPTTTEFEWSGVNMKKYWKMSRFAILKNRFLLMKHSLLNLIQQHALKNTYNNSWQFICKINKLWWQFTRQYKNIFFFSTFKSLISLSWKFLTKNEKTSKNSAFCFDTSRNFHGNSNFNWSPETNFWKRNQKFVEPMAEELSGEYWS